MAEIVRLLTTSIREGLNSKASPGTILPPQSIHYLFKIKEGALLPAGVLNPQLFQVLAQGGRQATLACVSQTKAQPLNPFGLTSHWVNL